MGAETGVDTFTGAENRFPLSVSLFEKKKRTRVSLALLTSPFSHEMRVRNQLRRHAPCPPRSLFIYVEGLLHRYSMATPYVASKRMYPPAAASSKKKTVAIV